MVTAARAGHQEAQQRHRRGARVNRHVEGETLVARALEFGSVRSFSTMETMQPRTTTYWLSMHLPYACRHSGACCSSGWEIPIERSRVEAVTTLRSPLAWLRPVNDGPEDVAGMLATSDDGRCVFHGDGCEIQHAFGHDALPSACQHFPREVLIDPRGVFVTLSHYCPTAADLLFSHVGAVEIVEGPPALPHGDPEGLDARDVLPPLLTEGVLMDLEAYAAWESHMVKVLAGGATRPENALARLRVHLAQLQRWRPRDGALVQWVSELPAEASVTVELSMCDVVLGRYLAARAFASWARYARGGVVSVLDALDVALARVLAHHVRLPLVEAIRQTDLELVHLGPRQGVATRTT